VIAKGKKRTVVQAKRWTRTVGYDAVKDAHAARAIYEATGALVVTSSTFSKHARVAAKKLDVALWDESELVRALLRVGDAAERDSARLPVADREATVSLAITEPVEPESIDPSEAFCARCGKPVSERVRDYCLGQAARFGGLAYCYKHQRSL
jgi:restriction system protein